MKTRWSCGWRIAGPSTVRAAIPDNYGRDHTLVFTTWIVWSRLKPVFYYTGIPDIWNNNVVQDAFQVHMITGNDFTFVWDDPRKTHL